MNFTNIIKGQITQSLITSLLERAGYRVTRFGIEELFSEVKHLDYQSYKALDLPDQLRTLPDLLVASSGIEKAYLVEIKYRKEFTESSVTDLYKVLSKQRQFWPNSIAVLIRGVARDETDRFHQDYIRVLPSAITDALNISYLQEDVSPSSLLSNADKAGLLNCKYNYQFGIQNGGQQEAFLQLWESLPMIQRIFTWLTDTNR